VSEVLVVAKTRMQQGRVCVGAHDLADFRSLRLFRYDGSRLKAEAGIDVGDVWEMHYVPRPHPTPPHTEDVLVREDARRVRREPNPVALILRRETIWRAPPELFDGRLTFSSGGSAYVPEGGPLPTRSTGYWQPDHDLTLYHSFDKPRYRWTGGGDLVGIGYVGVADPVPVIPAGSLVRLSLSHPFPPEGDQRGFWLQVSGWFC